ncbi:MAG TPA: hypothetical protein VES66_01860 [Terriglobales bacterium]|nr:hypothetical protein [Terriglobales bacterium]
MKRHYQLAVLLALAAWAAPLWAQDSHVMRSGSGWVEVVSGTLPSLRNLKVGTDFGAVTVRGGSPQGITYTVRKRLNSGSENYARRQFELFMVRASQKGDFAVLEGECSGAEKISVDISVNVPRDLAFVKVATRGGRVEVANLAGRLEAETAGGSIHINDIGGAVRAETSGGSIEVGNVGSDLRLETAGGSISIRSAGGKVHAETAGGSIEVGSATQSAYLSTAGGGIQVKKCDGELRAATAGGSVEIGDVGGGATLETSGGSIRLASAKGVVRATTSGGSIHLNGLTHGVTAKTAAGPIYAEFTATKGNFSESYLETSVGDVIVYLPPDLPVIVRAVIDAAMGHKMITDFSEVKITSEGGEWAREIYGQGAINGGGPLLKIRTTAGNIELRRGKR